MPLCCFSLVGDCQPYTAPLASTGDYSDAQLLRVNRQALALNHYYEYLAAAITTYQECGIPFLVYNIAALAGKSLGDEFVGGSTVRLWHAQYVEGNCVFKPDERGHHTRELLILEEDINQKFIRWSLAQAKSDDRSVESAHDFLNNQLLNTLEVAHV